MELIRKNWGLLLVSLVCLGGAVFLTIQLFGSMKSAKEAKGKLAQETDFFKSVKDKNIKLVPKNRQIARRNSDSASKRFEHARKQLQERFHIEVSYDPDPYVAVQQVLARVAKMRNKLLDAGVQLSGQHGFLSFDAYDPQKGTLPSRDPKVIAEIFRQLNIVEEVVRLVVESKVVALNEIGRPNGLERVTADLYNFVPVTLSVTGSSRTVQDLLNSFHQTKDYLLFVRNIESITSEDQAPGGVLGGTGTTGGGRGGMGNAGMDMGDGGMAAGAGMAAGGGMGGMQNAGRDGPGGGMGDEGGMAGGDGGTATAMATLLTRDQLQAFQDRYITAVIRLDLVEFIPAEQPEPEE